MRRTWPALLLLAWLRSPAAGEEQWRDLEGDFIREAVAALSSLETTREHMRFLKKRGTDLVVSSSGPFLSLPTGLGMYLYKDNTMYINQEKLTGAARELAERGMPPEEIPRTLAWKAVHVIVHELRHGLNHWQLRERTGIFFDYSTIEDEYTAFFDELCTVHEILRVKPELWEQRYIVGFDQTMGVLLGGMRRDAAGLKRLVRAQKSYEKKLSLLESDREELIARLRRSLDLISSAVRRKGEYSEAQRRQIEQIEEGYPYAEERIIRAIAVLQSERDFGALRAFYAAKLREMEEKLKAQRDR